MYLFRERGVEVTISNWGTAFKDDMLPHTTLYTKQFEAI